MPRKRFPILNEIKSLVGIYFDDMRPIPCNLLFLCLQYAGLIRVGHSSLQFRVNFR